MNWITKRAFGGDALKYLPSVAATTLVGIFLLPVLTRLFVPASYGNYVLTITVLSFLQAIAGSWLNSTLIRFYAVAELQAQARTLVTTALGVIVTWSLTIVSLSLTATLAFRSHLDPELLQLLLWMPALLAASNILELPLQVMRAQRRIGAYNALVVSRSLAAPLIGVAFSLLLGSRVLGLMLGTALTQWLLVPIAYGTCFGLKKPSALTFDKAWAWRLLAFGLPLAPTFLLEMILDLADRFIIQFYRGPGEVGIYATSYSVAWLPISLTTLLVSQAAAPLIVSTWEREGRQATEGLLAFITRVYWLVGLPAVVGLSLLSKDIMTLLAAPAYVEGAVIFPLIGAGAFVMGVQWIAQRGLMLGKKTNHILLFFSLAGLLNILLNFWLVPQLGYRGAGWSMLGSYSLLLVLVAWGSSRHLTWKLPYASIARSTLGCGAMFAVLYAWPRLPVPLVVNIVVKVLAGATAYGVLLLFTGETRLKGLLARWSSQGTLPNSDSKEYHTCE